MGFNGPAKSLFGGSATSYHGVESNIMSILILIFTRVIANILTTSGSQVDTFLILLIALYVWIVLQNAMQSVAEASSMNETYKEVHSRSYQLVTGKEYFKTIHHRKATLPLPGEDEGWTDTFSTTLEFVSQILVILTAQFAGNLIFQEWTTMGVTTQESITALLIAAIIFFPFFLWVHRIYISHGNQYKNLYDRAVQQVRMSHGNLVPVSQSKFQQHQLVSSVPYVVSNQYRKKTRIENTRKKTRKQRRKKSPVWVSSHLL
jgi:ABC-type multidrug transport system permease subunit